MKHLKEHKEHTPLSKGKKIAICIVIGLVVAGGVFTTLFFVNRISGYREAKNYTDEILGTKDAVVAYLDRKLDGEKLTEDDKKAIDDFKTAVEKAESYTESLSASKALKDKNVSEKYEKAKEELTKASVYKTIEQKIFGVLKDGEISEEELKVFDDSDNEFLKSVSSDLKEYRKKVSDFKEKYTDLKGANKKQLDDDYAAITNAGQELTKKYSEIKIDDVYKMSRDDILSFYATIEELNNYLSEKI